MKSCVLPAVAGNAPLRLRGLRRLWLFARIAVSRACVRTCGGRRSCPIRCCCAPVPYIERRRLVVIRQVFWLGSVSVRLPAVKKGSGRMLGGNKGTHSCETVGDSHSVPFLIALIRTLFIGKDMHYLLMPKIKIVVFVKYFCASKHFFLFLQPYKSIFLNSLQYLQPIETPLLQRKEEK